MVSGFLCLSALWVPWIDGGALPDYSPILTSKNTAILVGEKCQMLPIFLPGRMPARAMP